MGSRVPGIIFDMDGVLVDSEYAMRATSIESLARFGVNASHDDFIQFTGMGEDCFIGGVAAKYGLKYTFEMKEYAYKQYVKKAAELVYVFPNVKDVLERLRAEGYSMAVASAADLIKVSTNLHCIGVEEGFFDTVISGSDVVKKKPDPEMFLAAANRIGVAPEHCIVVEDALSGVAAARAAGMASIAITTSFKKEALAAACPDYIVENIVEAGEKIDEWRGKLTD